MVEPAASVDSDVALEAVSRAAENPDTSAVNGEGLDAITGGDIGVGQARAEDIGAGIARGQFELRVSSDQVDLGVRGEGQRAGAGTGGDASRIRQGEAARADRVGGTRELEGGAGAELELGGIAQLTGTERAAVVIQEGGLDDGTGGIRRDRTREEVRGVQRQRAAVGLRKATGSRQDGVDLRRRTRGRDTGGRRTVANAIRRGRDSVGDAQPPEVEDGARGDGDRSRTEGSDVTDDQLAAVDGRSATEGIGAGERQDTQAILDESARSERQTGRRDGDVAGAPEGQSEVSRGNSSRKDQRAGVAVDTRSGGSVMADATALFPVKLRSAPAEDTPARSG